MQLTKWVRTLPVCALVLCAACGGDSDAKDNDKSEADGNNQPADEAPCTVLTDGVWKAQGSAFAMAMTVHLTLNVIDCTFVLDRWQMNHGSQPNGGSIAADSVVLVGPDAYWSTCVGKASDDKHIAGVCTEDSAGFALALQ